MDFSEPYKTSGPPPAYSPDGRYLAAAVEYRLIIREAESLQVVQLYSCLDRIDHIEWSPNSMYCLAAMYSRAIVQVWSADQSDWACKIDEGPAGVAAARWSPDGSCVLAYASMGIRTTVWSLAQRRCHYLAGCKSGAADPSHTSSSFSPAAGFSPDGTQYAQLERYDCVDHISVYETEGWSRTAHFKADTSDAARLLWSPTGESIALTDDALYFGVAVYSPAGVALGRYGPPGEQYDGLGVKTAVWDPSGQFLAVGSYDQRVRVLSDVTWQPLLDGAHPAVVCEPPGLAVYMEEVQGPEARGTPGRSPAKSPSAAPPLALRPEIKSKYELSELPVRVPHVTPSMDKPHPKLGVGRLSWSPDGRYLVTVNDNMPTHVWVWDLAAGCLATLLAHAAPVADVAWRPEGHLLAAVTGCAKVYMWAPAGASVVHIPLRGFAAARLAWSPGGGSFTLMGGDAFCCAYLAQA
ncbi:hypothetical protein FOA52_004866 [Chlamydomonas sp. UWO 241]|nr:hypothetical protein FOA52_004866 [Chlamydomonas sp. UWO 241]